MNRPDLFESILEADDRDRGFARRPVLSYREDDEPEYLARIDALATGRVELSRRGAWHGQWAELPETLTGPPDASLLRRRWLATRPVVVPAVGVEDLAHYADEIRDSEALHLELVREDGELRRWIGANAERLEPDFVVKSRPAPLFDPERDVERVSFKWFSPRAQVPDRASRGRRRFDDLWIKTGWLSTYEDDQSLRMRFSFGREGGDDASRDSLGHHLVADLAARLLPETDLVEENPTLVQLLADLCGEPVTFTQHIAYWNCPEGGSSFHHDAFDEDPLGRQLGVCYLQLTGATAWLALSTADLAARVAEFAEFLEEGELPWVKAQLFGDERRWKAFRRTVRDPRALRRELALPGCGSLHDLVNRGPEFTSFLADCGHAAIVRAGEAVLLPNHGFEATSMHSVFCAADTTTYALSLAIRGTRVLEPIAPEEP